MITAGDSKLVRSDSYFTSIINNYHQPVTWKGLALMAVTGTGLAWYYQVEKEKRMNQSKIDDFPPPPPTCTEANDHNLFALLHLLSPAAVKKVTTYGKPALGGPWTLVDFTGRPVTDADFHGEFLLLYFGFTHCPDICPSELVKVGKIMDILGEQ